jgi:flagellar basal body rod protein FlgB
MNLIPETSAVVTASLDGALFRHQLGALNIANVNTADYRQKQMDFEAYMRAVVRDPASAAQVEPEQFTSVAVENGGLDKAVADMAENTLYYEAVLTGWEKCVGTLRLAITDGKG